LGPGTFGGTPNLPLLIDSFTFVLCWIIKNWKVFFMFFFWIVLKILGNIGR
jgi:hypothetical protein